MDKSRDTIFYLLFYSTKFSSDRESTVCAEAKDSQTWHIGGLGSPWQL
jgi:hypothetical protein